MGNIGRPKLRAFRLRMDEIDASGGMEWFMERIADGRTMQSIADELECSRGMLYLWLKCDPKRHEEFREARQLSAYAHAENALIMADEADNPLHSPLVRERCQHRRWMAEKANPVDFGKQNGPQVQINIGELHLDALKAANPVAALPGEIAVLAEGDSDDDGE